MLQLTYELRPKWQNNKNNNNKSQNAVSRSDPLQGSDKKFLGHGMFWMVLGDSPCPEVSVNVWQRGLVSL